MTTIFVYEFLCALGLGREVSDPAHSLYREGKAMQDALAADFAAMPDVAVVTLDNASAEDEPARFRSLAQSADWTVVIAPEFDRILEERCNWVREAGGRLLGSDDAAIRLTSDKLALFELWQARGVPTPRTWPREAFPGARESVVLKPRDGAGSTDTELVDPGSIPDRPNAIIQEYVPGRAASVAFLVGPHSKLPLIPTFQRLSQDGRFQYQGGQLPIPSDLAERATRIARRAVDCVPGLLGYVGVDLILGPAADGAGDRAVEINPRMTTSYVGLRVLSQSNLASAMVRIARGENIDPLTWNDVLVTFRPDGTVERVAPTQ